MSDLILTYKTTFNFFTRVTSEISLMCDPWWLLLVI